MPPRAPLRVPPPTETDVSAEAGDGACRLELLERRRRCLDPDETETVDARFLLVLLLLWLSSNCDGLSRIVDRRGNPRSA